MGIANLARMIEQLCPEAISTLKRGGNPSSRTQNLQYEHVYYDVNNVIYSLVGKNRSEEAFYLKLYKDIDDIVKLVRPKQSLFLAVDGPGPRAKVSTQLARRKKHDYIPDKDVQRMGFTPGTRLMQRLRQALFVYGATRTTSSRNRNLAIWVSGSDCAGEGENKCFNHMRRLPPHHKCLVIGNDSDLIAYTLQAHCEVHILRDKSDTLVDGKKVRQALARGIASEDQERRISDDFLLLSIMSGNDYIPSLAFYDFNVMWSVYRKMKLERPELRNDFLYDSIERTINWNLMELLHIEAGQEKKDYFDDGEGPGHGRLHPRALINEILAQGGDQAVFEVEGGNNMVGHVNVRVTSLHPQKPWREVGHGRSQREAIVNAALAAFKPDSSFLAHLVDNKAYSESSLQKIGQVMEMLRESAEEVQVWFQRRGIQLTDKKIVVGNLPGFVDMRERRAPKPQQKINMSDVYNRYVEGLIWSFEYYGGTVKNYGYHYPYRERISLHSLCKAAPQVSKKWDAETASIPPLLPLAMGLCLLPGQARKLLPEPFDALDLEHDPEVGEIFRYNSEALTNNPEMLTEYLNAVEAHTKKLAQTLALSDDANHLLSLHHPTAFMDRSNPLLRSIPREEMESFEFVPPKLPKGNAYSVLRDAPASNRTVAAVNLARPVQGSWFHFPGPHMQTRSFTTFSAARFASRLLKKIF